MLGASPAGQGTAGNICTFPFPVAAGEFNTWCGFFPRNSLAWSLERPKLGGKALLTLAFPGSKPPVCHSAFKPRRFSGMSLQGLFVPFPVPCVPSFTCASGCRGATLELQDSVVGGQGVVGGCEEEDKEEEGAVLPLQSNSHIQP